MSQEDSIPLIVLVSGGGPVGLTFSLNLALMMGKKAKIIIYDGRWFIDDNGIIRWQGEQQGRIRREQVVTLQDHVIIQMPNYIQDGLFQYVNERVWPTSRNIPIREVEDRLLHLIQPFVNSGQVELVPEQLNEQTERLIKGQFDILVGADGANSFVRRHCKIQMVSDGTEYACGVAYNIPDKVSLSEKPLHQALNCVLTISQTRYLVNSSTSRRGYLNVRLTHSEYDELKERLQELQKLNEPLDLMDFNKCPQSPVWTIIRQGLEFFKIAPKFVFRSVPIEINVRHASVVVRELRIEVKDDHSPSSPTTNDEASFTNHKKYKTILAFLAGDAAMNVHFWPGRGMNSGMKAAMALARNIFRSCTSKSNPNSIVVRTPLRFLDFLDYEAFMARLRAREQQGRSLRVLADPIDTAIKASYLHAHLNQYYVKYTTNLMEKLKETRLRLQERPEWPHKTRSITDEELQCATNRISPYSVAQLSLANPWPTREMSGADILVEDTYPFNKNNFLCLPAAAKKPMLFSSNIPIRQRFISLWIVGEPISEAIHTLLKSIQKLYGFTGTLSLSSTITTAEYHPSSSYEPHVQLVVVHTIEKAKEWIKSNRDLIRKRGTQFKVVTVWSPTDKLTAVDAIRAIRAEEARVPVFVFANQQEETTAALEFPSVVVTDAVFDLYDFIGIRQETQWNCGYPVSCSKKGIKFPEEKHRSKTPVALDKLDHSPKDSCSSSLGDNLDLPKPPDSSNSSSPKLPSKDVQTRSTPLLLWIDSEKNGSKVAKDLNQNHPQLEIRFVPTLRELRSYLTNHAEDIKKRQKILTICKGQYLSESKNALDIVRLFEEFNLSTSIGVYTSDRTTLRQKIPGIPERVYAFDQQNDLFAFVRSNLNK